MIGDERGADIRTPAAAVFQQEQRDLAETGEGGAVDDGATTALAAYQTGVRENAQMRRDDVLRHSQGRIETRTYTASSVVDWIGCNRSYPGQPRFTNIKTILKVHDHVEYADRCSFDTRYYISSAPLDIERLSTGARGHWGSSQNLPHWGVESMHWLLDVVFKDDLSRYREGNGAKNMAVVRRLSLNLIRANNAKGSIKTKRKAAG